MSLVKLRATLEKRLLAVGGYPAKTHGNWLSCLKPAKLSQ
jgi:hypothetical protein